MVNGFIEKKIANLSHDANITRFAKKQQLNYRKRTGCKKNNKIARLVKKQSSAVKNRGEKKYKCESSMQFSSGPKIGGENRKKPSWFEKKGRRG